MKHPISHAMENCMGNREMMENLQIKQLTKLWSAIFDNIPSSPVLFPHQTRTYGHTYAHMNTHLQTDANWPSLI